MAVIEKRLHEHFASLQDDDAEETAPPPSLDSIPRDSVPEPLDQPFAKVNSVVDNSPAAAAGLKPGDLIRNFGYVNIENNDGLKKVAECVQGNEGVSAIDIATCEAGDLGKLTVPQQNILVKVSRSSGGPRPQELRLTLTPRRNWGGRGMLGCHILPL
jgi:26S proteasome non-ATPase regulatory subunit 9